MNSFLKNDAMLLIIDVQERLAPAMNRRLFEKLVKNLTIFGEARPVLDLPVIITEQYPKGLGPTVESLRRAFPTCVPMAKVCFSAMAEKEIREAIAATGRRKVIVAGMESHICVYQTVRALVADYEVHVLSDAVASRSAENFLVGLRLAERLGCQVTSTETVLFDLLQAAGTEAFKHVSKLVR